MRGDERALVPDLARGLMLLLIVTSNVTLFGWAAPRDDSGQHPVPAHLPDAVAQFAMIVGLDMRIYPLFACLFGYGMAQLLRRQVAAGSTERDALRLLRRRSWWLLLFGLAHAALLLATDILGTYGLVSLLLGTLLLGRTDRTLRWCAAAGGGVLALVLLVGCALTLWAAAGNAPEPGLVGYTEQDEPAAAPALLSGSGEGSYLVSLVYRLQVWLVLTVLPTVGFTVPVAMLLGFLAGRLRVLEEPQPHLRRLRGAAAVGVGVGWLGGLPAALLHVGAVDLPAAVAEPGLLAMRWSTGLAGGLGYVALLGLLGHHLSARARGSAPVVAVTAVGKRSLSCYLAHSLLLGPILAAWGLGLGAHLGSASGVLYAAAAWLATAAAAYALERSARRGPAEVVLRQLVYRRTSASGGRR